MMRKINEWLLEELNNSFILWPIFLGVGIGIFFVLPFDPSIYLSLVLLAMAVSILWIVRDIELYRNLAIFMLLIVLGFAASSFRVWVVDAPRIEDSMEDVFLEGTVKTITIQDKSSKRLLLEDIEIDDINDVPKYIRLSTKINIDGIEVGDRVFARVNIMPIPQSSMVDGFNFALYSYFKEIGGIAVSISKIDVFRKGYKTSFMNYINKVRYTIAERIANVMDKTPSSLASALIIGDTSKIPEDDFNAIRISGIAHLMAISGLHIVTVVTITFFFLRFVLSKIAYVALRYDLKKIAAAGSILLSLGYLLISGMPISAQRAFLMSFLVLFAILLDRNHEAMRGVAIAALIILIATPENLFSPSLQMSFAACISLIASFKWFTKVLAFIGESYKFGKYIMYVLSVIFSTLVAGFATTPFVIYHFNQFSTYSVITNLIAIPLADFAIMPLSALSVLLMPLHLEYLPLKLLEFVLQFLMWCAHIVANMPAAFLYLPSFSNAGLVVITFGMLILCFLRTKLALFGAPLLLIGMMLHKADGLPDIIIDQNAKLVALNIDGKHYFSSMQSARFARKSWQQAYGMQDILPFKAMGEGVCYNNICNLSIKNLSTTIMLPKSKADDVCHDADVVIDLSSQAPKCRGNVLSLTAADLKTNGAHEVWITDGAVTVKTVAEHLKNRVWNRF